MGKEDEKMQTEGKEDGMKVIYVCSPFRGNIKENAALAKRLCRKAALEGFAVICPHLLYPQFLVDEGDERETGIRAGLKLLEAADEVWVADGKISAGMSREIARAGELGIPTKCVCDPRAAEERLLCAVMEEEDNDE